MAEIIKKEIELAGRTLRLEVGRLAARANAAVLAQYGETVVLATVTEDDPQEGVDYFPLRVDYVERLYAGGVIKGSRFVKREGRPSDESVLSGRVIDRSIRPLFPKGYFRDIQVIITALSVDQENDAALLAAVASSAALAVSDIPWDGPLGTVRVGYRASEDKLTLNPISSELAESDLDLIVSGTKDKVVMLEAGANEVAEEKMLEAIAFGQEGLQQVIGVIEELQKVVGKGKIAVEVSDALEIEEQVEEFVRQEFVSEILVAGELTADEQTERRERLYAKFEGKLSKAAMDKIYEATVKKAVREAILSEDKRLDGRALDELRLLGAEVGLLPRTHGSGLFNRGKTQVLTVATLGPTSLAQLLEGMNGERTKRYMHHYYFPPFSTGETKPLRSPGRREIGHGSLAEKALLPVIPPEEDFPYAIRLVSEVLSSAGSTSMAATCGSTLALMDAGVPIAAPVAGIAMGLVTDGEGKYKVLTDIEALEDFYGDMDFKITGTEKGITAIQLDIKIAGLTPEIIAEAVSGARVARLAILKKMKEAIEAPRGELSEYAPRITTVQIDPAKIGRIIGPRGKMIKAIVEETGAEIDVNDDGLVSISSKDPVGAEKARTWIERLVEEVVVGKVYEGRVTRIMDFGAFVEVLPGQEGLVHVSELAHRYVGNPRDIVKEGDHIKVKCIEIDREGRINFSKKALEQAPDGAGDRPSRPPRRQGGGGYRG